MTQVNEDDFRLVKAAGTLLSDDPAHAVRTLTRAARLADAMERTSTVATFKASSPCASPQLLPRPVCSWEVCSLSIRLIPNPSTTKLVGFPKYHRDGGSRPTPG